MLPFLFGCSYWTNQSTAMIEPIDLIMDKTKLSIGFPVNESLDFPSQEIVYFVSLDDHRKDIVLVDKYWDYPKRGLLRGRDGSLNMLLRLRSKPDTFSGDLTDQSQLIKLAVKKLDRPGVTFSGKYKNVLINGHCWLTYQYQTQNRIINNEMIHYLHPVSSTHYLQIQANFINNTQKDPNWKEKVLSDLNRIIESTRFDGLADLSKRPQRTDCQ